MLLTHASTFSNTARLQHIIENSVAFEIQGKLSESSSGIAVTSRQQIQSVAASMDRHSPHIHQSVFPSLSSKASFEALFVLFVGLVQVCGTSDLQKCHHRYFVSV